MFSSPSLGVHEILKIIFIVIVVYLLLLELYILNHRGKLIMKIREKRCLTNSGIIILALCISYFIYDFIRINYKNGSQISTLGPIILSSILIFFKIIIPEKYLEIRENGIYIFSNFFKWNKVKSYNWISKSKIQFKVTTAFRRELILEVNIKELCTKEQIDKILHKYIISGSNS